MANTVQIVIEVTGAQQLAAVSKAAADVGAKIGTVIPKAAKEAQEASAGLMAQINNLRSSFKEGEGGVSLWGLAMRAAVNPVTAMVVAAGAAVFAVHKMTESFVENAKEVRGLMNESGLAVEKASALNNALLLMGKDSDVVKAALFKMGTEIDSGGAAIARLGVGLRDSSGALKNEGQLFLEVRDKLSKIGDESLRNAISMAIFGRGARELTGIMAMSAEQFQALLDKGQKLNPMTQEMVDKAKALGKAQHEAGLAWQGLTNTIIQDTLPTQTALFKQLAEIYAVLQKIAAWVPPGWMAKGAVGVAALPLVPALLPGMVVGGAIDSIGARRQAEAQAEANREASRASSMSGRTAAGPSEFLSKEQVAAKIAQIKQVEQLELASIKQTEQTRIQEAASADANIRLMVAQRLATEDAEIRTLLNSEGVRRLAMEQSINDQAAKTLGAIDAQIALLRRQAPGEGASNDAPKKEIDKLLADRALAEKKFETERQGVIAQSENVITGIKVRQTQLSYVMQRAGLEAESDLVQASYQRRGQFQDASAAHAIAMAQLSGKAETDVAADVLAAQTTAIEDRRALNEQALQDKRAALAIEFALTAEMTEASKAAFLKADTDLNKQQQENDTAAATARIAAQSTYNQAAQRVALQIETETSEGQVRIQQNRITEINALIVAAGNDQGKVEALVTLKLAAESQQRIAVLLNDSQKRLVNVAAEIDAEIAARDKLVQARITVLANLQTKEEKAASDELAVQAGLIEKKAALRQKDVDNAITKLADIRTAEEKAASDILAIRAGGLTKILADRQRDIDNLNTLSDAQTKFFQQGLEGWAAQSKAIGDTTGFFEASFLAALTKGTDTFSSLKTLAEGVAADIKSAFSTFFVDFINGVREGKSIWESFTSALGSLWNALMNSLIKRFADFLVNLAIQAAASQASGGALGALLALFGAGAGVAAGSTTTSGEPIDFSGGEPGVPGSIGNPGTGSVLGGNVGLAGTGIGGLGGIYGFNTLLQAFFTGFNTAVINGVTTVFAGAGGLLGGFASVGQSLFASAGNVASLTPYLAAVGVAINLFTAALDIGSSNLQIFTVAFAKLWHTIAGMIAGTVLSGGNFGVGLLFGSVAGAVAGIAAQLGLFEALSKPGAMAKVIFGVGWTGILGMVGLKINDPLLKAGIEFLLANPFAGIANLIDAFFGPSSAWQTFPQRLEKTLNIEIDALKQFGKELSDSNSLTSLAQAIADFRTMIDAGVPGYAARAFAGGPFSVPGIPGATGTEHEGGLLINFDDITNSINQAIAAALDAVRTQIKTTADAVQGAMPAELADAFQRGFIDPLKAKFEDLVNTPRTVDELTQAVKDFDAAMQHMVIMAAGFIQLSGGLSALGVAAAKVLPPDLFEPLRLMGVQMRQALIDLAASGTATTDDLKAMADAITRLAQIVQAFAQEAIQLRDIAATAAIAFTGPLAAAVDAISNHLRQALVDLARSGTATAADLQALEDQIQALATAIALYQTLTTVIAGLTNDTAALTAAAVAGARAAIAAAQRAIDDAHDQFFKATSGPEMAQIAAAWYNAILAKYELERQLIQGISQAISDLLSKFGAQLMASSMAVVTMDLDRGSTASLQHLIEALDGVQAGAFTATVKVWAAVQALAALAASVPGIVTNFGGKITDPNQLTTALYNAALPSLTTLANLFGQTLAAGDIQGALDLLNQGAAAIAALANAAIAGVRQWEQQAVDAANALAQRQIDAQNQATQIAIDAVNAEAAAKEEANTLAIEALNEQKSAIEAAIQLSNQWKSVMDSVSKLIVDLKLGTSSPLNPRAALAFAESNLSIAEAAFAANKTPENATAVQQAIQNVLAASQHVFTRPSPEYLTLFNAMIAKLEAVKAFAASQVTPEQQSAESLKAIDQKIKDLNDDTKKIRDSAAAQVKALEALRDANIKVIEANRDAVVKGIHEAAQHTIDGIKDAVSTIMGQIATEQFRLLGLLVAQQEDLMRSITGGLDPLVFQLQEQHLERLALEHLRDIVFAALMGLPIPGRPPVEVPYPALPPQPAPPLIPPPPPHTGPYTEPPTRPPAEMPGPWQPGTPFPPPPPPPYPPPYPPTEDRRTRATTEDGSRWSNNSYRPAPMAPVASRRSDEGGGVQVVVHLHVEEGAVSGVEDPKEVVRLLMKEIRREFIQGGVMGEELKAMIRKLPRN